MSGPFIKINSWADVATAIARMQVAGAGHRVPVMQALFDGRIAHLELHRGSSAKLFKQWTAMSSLPALALLGDDDYATPDGPDSWPIAQRVLRWAKFVLIHGGAGQPEHYEYAVVLTATFRRVVMIECSSANVPTWRAAAEQWALGARGQIMQPAPGLRHPSLTRGQVQ